MTDVNPFGTLRRMPHGPVRPPKRGAALARRIEQDIIARGWPVGEVLGNEVALLERYGASRNVLREAIRILEHRQLVVTRRGPGGGVIVNAPASEVVAEAIAVSFEFSSVSVAELFEAREVLEGLAVRLACARATDDELATLPTPVPGVGPGAEPGGIHSAIARLSGNGAVPLFLDSLLALTNDRVLARFDRDACLPAGHDDEHSELLAALAARDAEAAEAILVRHLGHLRAWVSDATDPSAPGPLLRETGVLKLPEVVARELRRQILAEGLCDGYVIGSEPDLLARFGVSRSVLREAVRILEHHGLASMRRGIGGGLVVRTPDPSAAVDAAVTYLEYLRPNEQHLLELRDAVETAVATLAVRHLTPDAAARLHDHLDSELAADDFNLAAVDFHALLAEVCGNRALHVFTSVLMALQREHSPQPEEARPGEAADVEINRAHRMIVAAVEAGDEAVAVRRMRRHVGAVMPYVDVTRRRP